MRAQLEALLLLCRCTRNTHTHTQAEKEPRTSPSESDFSPVVLPQVQRGEAGAKTSKNTVGATAEVEQYGSCGQSFNLKKRTGSPWGAGGRMKEFNNSMFYGPRK